MSQPPQSLEHIKQLINQWNANRLDLFEISNPTEDGEFNGVMRFYFQEDGEKVATKCIRVSSTATVQKVIEILIEKFRPDLKMLSLTDSESYLLYEIHENGDEKILNLNERPLLIQLNWSSDDREGRFLLKKKGSDGNALFKRKLSKKEKKKSKQLVRMEMEKNNEKKREKLKPENIENNNDVAKVSEKLYTELPETSFTRSISNPEAVMRRRRQQKLERKLAQFRSKDGGPDTGGTLKIYGESLCKDVPYKTLLLSINDNAAHVVKEMLIKYSIPLEHTPEYCLVQVSEGDGATEDYVLENEESPLAILMTHQINNQGSTIMFHVRKKSNLNANRILKRKKKITPGNLLLPDFPRRNSFDDNLINNHGNSLPLLIELLPDGNETGRRIILNSKIVEIGASLEQPNEIHSIQYLPGLRDRHCVLAFTDNIVTVTPSSFDADIYINGARILETTILQNGNIVRFGRNFYFRFIFHAAPPQMAPQQQLPATVELSEENENNFLRHLAALLKDGMETNSFKLSGCYAVYLVIRYRSSINYKRNEINIYQRARLLKDFILKVANLIYSIIVHECYGNNNNLSLFVLFLSNVTELLNFLKQDKQVSIFTMEAQDSLIESIQICYKSVLNSIFSQLLAQNSENQSALSSLFKYSRDANENENDATSVGPLLQLLAVTMTTLRRNRVNAAITIQVFSQVFHFVNMATFNRLVNHEGAGASDLVVMATETEKLVVNRLYSNAWGERLRRRLARIENWAQKQGLELAADCHLVRVVQATHFLQHLDVSRQMELVNLIKSCFKLNQRHLSLFLNHFNLNNHFDSNGIINKINSDFINHVIFESGHVNDVTLKLEEEPIINLTFLLPEDGYSCDILRGIPDGLIEFLSPLIKLNQVKFIVNSNSHGYWTIYFNANAAIYKSPSEPHLPRPPEPPQSPQTTLQPPTPSIFQQNVSKRIRIVLKKLENNKGLGLSIVAAKGVGEDHLGIYVKSVVRGGSADLDGRIAAGDQIISVDGLSLIGISQEKAAEHLLKTDSVVSLEICKEAAISHGIATMLFNGVANDNLSKSTPSLLMPPSTPTINNPHGNQPSQIIHPSRSFHSLHSNHGNERFYQNINFIQTANNNSHGNPRSNFNPIPRNNKNNLLLQQQQQQQNLQNSRMRQEAKFIEMEEELRRREERAQIMLNKLHPQQQQQQPPVVPAAPPQNNPPPPPNLKPQQKPATAPSFNTQIESKFQQRALEEEELRRKKRREKQIKFIDEGEEDHGGEEEYEEEGGSSPEEDFERREMIKMIKEKLKTSENDENENENDERRKREELEELKNEKMRLLEETEKEEESLLRGVSNRIQNSSKKVVSFSSFSDHHQGETTRVFEDPNKFIAEATAMFLHGEGEGEEESFKEVSSPQAMVIGAQEIYNDPRTKRLEQLRRQKEEEERTPQPPQQMNKLASLLLNKNNPLPPPGIPKPEKLSFQEKMKMFQSGRE